MSEWLQVKNLEMLVSKSELNLDIYKNNDILLFSCDLLNIARGRCDLVLKKTTSSSISNININVDKPVMEGEINFSKEKFENILDSIYKGCKQENSRTENTYFNAVSIVIGSIQFGKYKHIKITLFTI